MCSDHRSGLYATSTLSIGKPLSLRYLSSDTYSFDKSGIASLLRHLSSAFLLPCSSGTGPPPSQGYHDGRILSACARTSSLRPSPEDSATDAPGRG